MHLTCTMSFSAMGIACTSCIRVPSSMRWIGPFEISHISKNRQAITLKLCHSDNFHNVVPVHRIKRYYEDDGTRSHLEPPLPEKIGDHESYEVEKILKYRFNKKRNRREYLIKFLGYENDYNLWLPNSELRETCRDMLENFDIENEL